MLGPSSLAWVCPSQKRALSTWPRRLPTPAEAAAWPPLPTPSFSSIGRVRASLLRCAPELGSDPGAAHSGECDVCKFLAGRIEGPARAGSECQRRPQAERQTCGTSAPVAAREAAKPKLRPNEYVVNTHLSCANCYFFPRINNCLGSPSAQLTGLSWIPAPPPCPADALQLSASPGDAHPRHPVLTPGLASDSPLGRTLQQTPHVLQEPPFRSESIFLLSCLIEKALGLELEVGNYCPKTRKALLPVAWVPCHCLGRQRLPKPELGA